MKVSIVNCSGRSPSPVEGAGAAEEDAAGVGVSTTTGLPEGAAEGRADGFALTEAAGDGVVGVEGVEGALPDPAPSHIAGPGILYLVLSPYGLKTTDSGVYSSVPTTPPDGTADPDPVTSMFKQKG